MRHIVPAKTEGARLPMAEFPQGPTKLQCAAQQICPTARLAKSLILFEFFFRAGFRRLKNLYIAHRAGTPVSAVRPAQNLQVIDFICLFRLF